MNQKKLHRRKEGSVLGGVCTGLGEYFAVEPIIFRVIFILLTLMSGFGFVVYLVLWLVTPLAEKTYHSEDYINENSAEIAGYIKERGARVTDSARRPAFVGLILIVIGLSVLAESVIPAFSLSRSWPLLLIAAGLLFLMRE